MSDTCPNCKDGTKYLGKAEYVSYGKKTGNVDDIYQCPKCYWSVVIPRSYIHEA